MTRKRLIDPKLELAGWDEIPGNEVQVWEEYPVTEGALVGGGKRGRNLKADYVLEYKGRKLAVVEAKKEDLSARGGRTQVHEYSELLEAEENEKLKQVGEKMQLKFGYSTNGHKIIEYNLATGENHEVDSFPTPDELWRRIFDETNAQRDKFSSIPMYNNDGRWKPRYYQELAVNKALDAIAEGKNRMLLTLATGTGKTNIAMEVVYKLFHANWNRKDPGTRKPKVLFLADRTILADQAFQAFDAFERGACTRFTPDDMKDGKSVPTNADIIFTIYQTGMSGAGNMEEKPYYQHYDPDFFDLVIIDECHRGGANSESTWRDMLEYFSSAVQLGLTATPKRKDNVDTYKYFGEPLFEYSLKSGIEDGFLTPFRVMRITSNIDTYQYEDDDVVLSGEVDKEREYTQRDLGLIAHIKEREEHRVLELLKVIGPDEKTLIFCQSQLAASAIRDLMNHHAGLGPDYCQRVTADEGPRGDAFLKSFRNTDSTRPLVLTTSTKLSTGVDARQVKNVVLMRPVPNIIEFKQIVGRGTRISADKDYFTLIDFAGAVERFKDEEWDGPIEYKTSEKRGSREASEPTEPSYGGKDSVERPELIEVKLSDARTLSLKSEIKTTFYDPESGELLTSEQYLRRLFDFLPSLFEDEQALREAWSLPDTRAKLLEQLEENGYSREKLIELRDVIDGASCDIYDALNFIAHQSQMEPRLSRAQRAKIQMNSYNPVQQEFLNFILDSYVASGSKELDKDKLSSYIELKFGTIQDAKSKLAMDEQGMLSLYRELQKQLYSAQSA